MLNPVRGALEFTFLQNARTLLLNAMSLWFGPIFIGPRQRTRRESQTKRKAPSGPGIFRDGPGKVMGMWIEPGVPAQLFNKRLRCCLTISPRLYFLTR